MHSREQEQKIQAYWHSLGLWKATTGQGRKYYILDMFPYPSGAGLHVGHLLGYFFSDTIAIYKRIQGYNVLHPMGFDAFGLPAEQYALATGQPPELTTRRNIAAYKKLLGATGMSFDWDREVCTTDPAYYRWTQWIFLKIFSSWYNKKTNRAEPIERLIALFEQQGNKGVVPPERGVALFSAKEWQRMDAKKQEAILAQYRLAYRADTVVNWCPALGTVLANDEVKGGRSERGGHPVEQKRLVQWKLRMTVYADRLLQGLAACDWPEAIVNMQTNWIGRSAGANIDFSFEAAIPSPLTVFTTCPETLFGVSYLALAPDHPIVEQLLHYYTAQIERLTQQPHAPADPYLDELRKYHQDMVAYIEQTHNRSERTRLQEATTVTGCFTGYYMIHPLTKARLPLWLADYVLAGYGTGAVMGVPSHDTRDYAFASHFGLPVVEVMHNDPDTGEETLKNSSFLNGLSVAKAKEQIVRYLTHHKQGVQQISYRMRDPVFSRQRYWGEPFPIYYKDEVPSPLPQEQLPLVLPHVDTYHPSPSGEPPLSRAKNWEFAGCPLEQSTMPGWAGSSWYFFRYMDPHNDHAFATHAALDYWQAVDLYVGGAEHATGHLLYARFVTKLLYDLGYVPVEEPFTRLINQGMICSLSAFVYRVNGTHRFVSYGLKEEYETTRLHVATSLVKDDVLDLPAFRAWRPDLKDAEFILEEGRYICGRELEKMSKSKYNTVDAQSIIDEYGSDALRLHLLFLGPISQTKPWDTKGIEGVVRFLKKVHTLFYEGAGTPRVQKIAPGIEEQRILHQTIRQVTADLERYSLNTAVSALMICVNELLHLGCTAQEVLEKLLVLLAPFAPHTAEALWQGLGKTTSVMQAEFPTYDPELLVQSSITYPIAINGKTRLQRVFPASADEDTIKAQVAALPELHKWLQGKPIKQIIVVPKRMINIVC